MRLLDFVVHFFKLRSCSELDVPSTQNPQKNRDVSRKNRSVSFLRLLRFSAAKLHPLNEHASPENEGGGIAA